MLDFKVWPTRRCARVSRFQRSLIQRRTTHPQAYELLFWRWAQNVSKMWGSGFYKWVQAIHKNVAKNFLKCEILNRARGGIYEFPIKFLASITSAVHLCLENLGCITGPLTWQGSYETLYYRLLFKGSIERMLRLINKCKLWDCLKCLFVFEK